MLAIITPIKDEINNLDRLIDSIERQSVAITCWIIVENDSNDGTKERLNEITHVANVDNLIIESMNFEDKSYQLGFKYSTVVNEGFNILKKLEIYKYISFIGILDADCFPEKNYYRKLIEFMSNNSKIGIVSGILVLDNGLKGFSNKNHVRGSGRLWKKQCFDEAGYAISMSADSNSRLKAELRGWHAKVVQDAIFHSREANSRYDLTYGGKSAYYNGFTLSYIAIKSFIYFFRNNKMAYSYFKGYIYSLINKLPKNPDHEILLHNKKHLRRIILSKFIRDEA